ncbi:MAG: DUF5009 domain-containing protein, partial [Planctomycetales bacterium]|nr:DUF5009 domain-containing protein [Planctomycetales bacterium]
MKNVATNAPCAIDALSPLESPSAGSTRVGSLDVYRGFVMLLLTLTAYHGSWAETLAAAHPDSSFLRTLAWQFEHVPWRGLTLWDMIQPSFMFLVGTSAAYSYASRTRRGESRRSMLAHAVRRAVVLSLLGVFLRSIGRSQTYWTF